MDGKGDCLIMYYIYSYTAQVVVKHQEIMGEMQCLQSINHIKYSRLRREKKGKRKNALFVPANTRQTHSDFIYILKYQGNNTGYI